MSRAPHGDSGAPAPEDPPPLDEQAFRTLAAPGLDEDDLFAAMHGLPGRGALWGEGRACAFPPHRDELGWDPVGERRRRHLDLLRRWEPSEDAPGAASDRQPDDAARGPRSDERDQAGRRSG